MSGFDEDAAFDELEKIMKYEPINGKRLKDAVRGNSTSVALAKWQHSQDKATIEELVGVIAEIRNATILWPKDQTVTRLREVHSLAEAALEKVKR